MFDVRFAGFGQPVQAQAVFIRLDFRQQGAFQLVVLHGVDAAFKHRFLHALANGFAHARHAAQAATAGRGFGGDVVTHNNQHGQRTQYGK